MKQQHEEASRELQWSTFTTCAVAFLMPVPPHPLQDWQFICKIRKKSGMDTPSVTHGNHVNPLEDLIIHLCIKDALTCRTVIEVGLVVRNFI